MSPWSLDLASSWKSMRTRLLVLSLLLLLGGAVAWVWLAGLESVENSKTAPYSLIEDRLYVGGSVSEPPAGTEAVVNVCFQEDNYQCANCLAEPMDGVEPPSIERLHRIVQFIDEQRRAGRTTYVHCLAGMNRSGMVVTAYLMYEHKWSVEQALAYARTKRPQIHPNSAMMRLLAEWERTLRD